MKIYYLNSTHWDREWYLPFQSFRFNLVEMINDLLDILEKDPEYKLFCLDGQTIVLEDYAEIEPERAKKLKKYIEDGRIRVGPWYVMPDEFLVSGESLIRNLMTGHRISKEWGGKVWKYGYVNDIFGHIAQMPQIFAGFGIYGSYLGRGLGNTDFTNFVWKSPDGTKCYSTIGNYGAFARRKMAKYQTEEFPAMLKEYIDTAISRSAAPVVLFSNTDDHKKATAFTPAVLNMIKELYPDAELCDVDLSEMADELKNYEKTLPVICGELSKPLKQSESSSSNLALLYHTLSSYYPLKYQNDRCQNLLENRIEPMVAISNIENNYINHKYVEIAYKYLLQNHPHDSICGCSADQVHKDMIYRFDQTNQICERLYNRFLEFKRDVHWNEGSASEYELKLYNFEPYAKDEYITANVDFYKGFETQISGYAHKEVHNNFLVMDENGNEIPYQIIKIERNVKKRLVNVFQSEASFDIYTLGFKTKLPPFGVKTLKIVPSHNKVAYGESMQCGINWAENDLVRLEISPNGTLSVTDKRNGRKYTGLNSFVDNGEVGDGWHHESPINDIIVSDVGTNATVSRITSGFACVKFEIRKKLSLPQYLDGNSYLRSEKRIDLEICSTVTLKADSPSVEIETSIDNNVKDHRLRVLFPTNTNGNKYFAGQAFAKVERNVGTDAKTLCWYEPETLEKNTNGIIGKRDESLNGLAFVSPYGIHEAGCSNDSDATIVVTLFRSFDRVFLQNKSVRSQLQGKMHFKYALVPLDNSVSYADLLRIKNDLAETNISYSKRVLDNSKIDSLKSYFEISDYNIVISIFKCAEDKNGYILRLYNATDNDVNTELKINFEFKNVYENNLNEETLGELKSSSGIVKLSFKPWQIKTIRIV